MKGKIGGGHRFFLRLILKRFKTDGNSCSECGYGGMGASVMSGQENKGKVCTRHENVFGIRSASETNFEVNIVLANTDLSQAHGIF